MIPVENAHMQIAAGTHPGMRGKNNEDLYAVSAYQLSDSNDTPVVFAIVADGIGGHNAGEVASKIAVETISQAVALSDGSRPPEIMQTAIMQASKIINIQAEANDNEKGMGTTCVCAWIINNKLYIASVGNSRIYLLRNGYLSQINIDHTWVQEAIDAGALTPAQGRRHPHANVIRRYLGSRKPVEVDLRLRLSPTDSEEQMLKNQGMLLYPGDRLLLCSDGLNDMIEDDLIRDQMAGANLDKAIEDLIESANRAGGKDNITTVILEMPAAPRQSLLKFLKNRARLLVTLLGISAILIGITVIAALSYLGWNSLFGSPKETLTPTVPAATEMILPTTAPTTVVLPSPTSIPQLRNTPTRAPNMFASPTETNVPSILLTSTYTAVPLNTYTPLPPMSSQPTETPTP